MGFLLAVQQQQENYIGKYINQSSIGNQVALNPHGS